MKLYEAFDTHQGPRASNIHCGLSTTGDSLGAKRYAVVLVQFWGQLKQPDVLQGI